MTSVVMVSIAGTNAILRENQVAEVVNDRVPTRCDQRARVVLFDERRACEAVAGFECRARKDRGRAASFPGEIDLAPLDHRPGRRRPARRGVCNREFRFCSPTDRARARHDDFDSKARWSATPSKGVDTGTVSSKP